MMSDCTLAICMLLNLEAPRAARCSGRRSEHEFARGLQPARHVDVGLDAEPRVVSGRPHRQIVPAYSSQLVCNVGRTPRNAANFWLQEPVA